MESPLRTELFVDSFSNTSGQLLREHTRNPRHLDLHLHTRHRDIHATRLLRSHATHATSTLGFLSVRKETSSIGRTAVISRCPPKQMKFACGRQIQFLQSSARPLRYREPVTRNPGHRAIALQIVDPISVYAVGEYIHVIHSV